MAVFPGYALGVEHGAVFGRDMAIVADKDVEALVFGEDGGTGAALSGAENYYAAVIALFFHYICNVSCVSLSDF